MTQKPERDDDTEGDLRVAQPPAIIIAPGLKFDPGDTEYTNFNIQAQQHRPPLNWR